MNEACIHSITDVITNSSTEIYTSLAVGAEAVAKDFINKLLQGMGCTTKAEEHFDIKVITEEDDNGSGEERKRLSVISRIDGKEIDMVDELMGLISQYAEYNG